jgi:hypothetical protein
MQRGGARRDLHELLREQLALVGEAHRHVAARSREARARR